MTGSNAVRKSPRLASRFRAKYRGTIDSITVPPAASAPSFSAVVLAGPGQMTGARSAVPVAVQQSRPSDAARRGTQPERIRLIWIGQRQIAGIAAGTALEFEGMVSVVDGAPTIYNPRYEIIRRQERT